MLPEIPDESFGGFPRAVLVLYICSVVEQNALSYIHAATADRDSNGRRYTTAKEVGRGEDSFREKGVGESFETDAGTVCE